MRLLNASRYNTLKKYIYIHLTSNTKVSKVIYALIIINTIAIILESYQELNATYSSFFELIEYFSVSIFTIEYALRLWTSNLNDKFKGSSFLKRIKFTFSTLGIIDLLAILPFYLPYFFTFDLRVIRILRLFRLLRVLKLTRYSKSLKTMHSVFQETKSDLITTIFVTTILLIFSSTLMFFAENESQPDKFQSIGHSFWWAVATLTTVGYGDVYPVTSLGKFLSGIIAIVGIGFVALPTGIISTSFMNKVQAQNKLNKEKLICSHCGNENLK